MSSKKSIVAELRRKALDAQLRHQLWSQDTYWVPEAGWRKLQSSSLLVTVVGDADPDGGMIERTARSQVWVRLDLDSLDEAAGEKMPVTSMSVSHRRNVLRFIERHVPLVLHGLYWDIPTDLFGDRVPDAVMAEHEELLDVLHDPQRRAAWFDQLPLVAALRESINSERDARLPARPVLLGATG